MTAPSGILACALILLPSVGGAQTISGVTEWTIAKGSSVAGDQSSTNDSVWQLYTIGFTAPLLDPRLMKYNTEISLRTDALALGAGQDLTEGHHRDVGYKLGASLFPARPFPVFVQLSRDVAGESGNYPTSAGLRGGIVVPADTPLPSFSTVTSSLVAGGQLNLPRQMRVDLGYTSGRSTMTGGPYEADQRDSDLHASLHKDGANTRQSLRFQQTGYTSAVSQSFDQTATDLDYEFSALVGARSRVLVHSGQRRSYSLFDLPQAFVDNGQAQYTLSRRGDTRTRYVTTGVTWEPARRVSFDVTGGFDQQDADATMLSSRLVSTSARLEVFRGLSLNASGVYGGRGQVFDDQPVTVVTKNGAGGVTLHRGPRWLEGTLSATRGIGVNVTPDGRRGQVNLWSGQGYLSSSWPWVSVSGGYERLRSEDGILNFGNYDAERRRGSIQQSIGRWSFMGTEEDAVTSRGAGLSLTQTRQRTLSGMASLRLGRETTLSANVGGFTSITGPESDRTRFYGATFDAQPRRGLRIAMWARREQLQATQTATSQDNLFWLGSIEYRLRQFLVGVELRNNDQRLQFPGLADPFRFSGRQVRVRLSRKFGMRL